MKNKVNVKSVLKLTWQALYGAGLIAAIGIGTLSPTFAQASVPACSLTDGCESSDYNWADYSCYIAGLGTRCWAVERQLCPGAPPYLWRYRSGSSWEAYPCDNPCAQGSRCLPPNGGGGGS